MEIFTYTNVEQRFPPILQVSYVNLKNVLKLSLVYTQKSDKTIKLYS